MTNTPLEGILAGGGQGNNYSAMRAAYPVRSREFLDFLAKVESFMRSYQNPPTKGGAPKTPEVLKRLLIDGYRWNDGAVGISLRESESPEFHGADLIAVREQVLINPSDTGKPRSLGVIAYEGGNSKLHAYAIFSLNGNSMYKDTTDDYELPHEMGAAETQDRVPINVHGFLSDIYSHRNTLTLKELQPKVSLTSHLTRRKTATSPAQP